LLGCYTKADTGVPTNDYADRGDRPAFGGRRGNALTDLGLFDTGDGVRAPTHVRYAGYRVGMVDVTLLTHQLVASRSIHGWQRGLT
jgi:hypothetical protein